MPAGIHPRPDAPNLLCKRSRIRPLNASLAVWLSPIWRTRAGCRACLPSSAASVAKNGMSASGDDKRPDSVAG
jgi:hypothetical protein